MEPGDHDKTVASSMREFEQFVNPIPPPVPTHTDIMRAINALVDSHRQLETIITGVAGQVGEVKTAVTEHGRKVDRLLAWKRAIQAVSDQ